MLKMTTANPATRTKKQMRNSSAILSRRTVRLAAKNTSAVTPRAPTTNGPMSKARASEGWMIWFIYMKPKIVQNASISMSNRTSTPATVPLRGRMSRFGNRS